MVGLGRLGFHGLEADKDTNDNAISQSALAIDCSNTLLHSETDNLKLVGLGISDLVAIATPDAVLVAKKDRAQDVKNLVVKLKSENIVQAEFSPKDHRALGLVRVFS